MTDMTCSCRCHVNPGAGCTVDGGYSVGCGPHAHVDRNPAEDCRVCPGHAGHHQPDDDDCVLQHSYSKKSHPPKAQFGHVCRYCVTRHREWLGEIFDLYATLVMILLPGSIPDNTAAHGHTKKAPEAPAPVRLGALAMTADRNRLLRTGDPTDLPDVPAVLTDMAQRYCDDNSLEGASLNGTASAAVRLLTEHAETLATMPWIDEYDAELGWMRRQLRTEHGISNQPAQPVGRCPSLDGDGHPCNGPLWPDRHGVMAVECGTCRAASTNSSSATSVA
jgi:hypothetical protein